MTVQIQNTNRRLLQREFWRISELATSAEQKLESTKLKMAQTEPLKHDLQMKGYCLLVGQPFMTLYEKVTCLHQLNYPNVLAHGVQPI